MTPRIPGTDFDKVLRYSYLLGHLSASTEGRRVLAALEDIRESELAAEVADDLRAWLED